MRYSELKDVVGWGVSLIKKYFVGEVLLDIMLFFCE